MTGEVCRRRRDFGNEHPYHFFMYDVVFPIRKYMRPNIMLCTITYVYNVFRLLILLSQSLISVIGFCTIFVLIWKLLWMTLSTNVQIKPTPSEWPTQMYGSFRVKLFVVRRSRCAPISKAASFCANHNRWRRCREASSNQQGHVAWQIVRHGFGVVQGYSKSIVLGCVTLTRGKKESGLMIT